MMGWDGKYFGAHSLRRALPATIYAKSRDLKTLQIDLVDELDPFLSLFSISDNLS